LVSVDGGRLLAAGTEALVASGEITKEHGKAYYGSSTTGSANARAIKNFEEANPGTALGRANKSLQENWLSYLPFSSYFFTYDEK
jgi:hypothetical protein